MTESMYIKLQLKKSLSCGNQERSIRITHTNQFTLKSIHIYLYLDLYSNMVMTLVNLFYLYIYLCNEMILVSLKKLSRYVR